MKIIIDTVTPLRRRGKKALYGGKIIDERGRILWQGKARNSLGQAQADAEKALARLEKKAE
jgi:hypothetical protein